MRFKKRKGQIERGYKPRQSSILSHITIQRAKSILSAWSSKLRCAKQTSLDWISKRTIEPGFQGLLNIQSTTFVILLTFNFICGLFILNVTDTMRRFLPHLICLTANAAITVAIGRYYVRTINALSDEIEGKYTSENTELRQVFRSFKKKTFKKVNLLPCLVILGVFFWGIFTQHYIKLDLVGCYAVFIVTVVVSISVIGYMQYIWLLWFLVRVNNCSTMYFNRSNPAQTPILVFLAQLTNRVKWCFFIEGFLYVLEYFILIPPAQLSLPSLQMPDNVSFLITWLFWRSRSL